MYPNVFVYPWWSYHSTLPPVRVNPDRGHFYLTFSSEPFGVDHLLGIESNILNFHHAYLYGEGTLGYLAASGNLVGTYVKDPLKKNVYGAVLTILPLLHGHYLEVPVTHAVKEGFRKIKRILIQEPGI
ncbi:hypothetical protein HZB02_02725 [Candidatus Woesearchaeota archaeon]|nr:hypothetical protein [Candidatus Woesearchaeota archaeon]